MKLVCTVFWKTPDGSWKHKIYEVQRKTKPVFYKVFLSPLWVDEIQYDNIVAACMGAGSMLGVYDNDAKMVGYIIDDNYKKEAEELHKLKIEYGEK